MAEISVFPHVALVCQTLFRIQRKGRCDTASLRAYASELRFFSHLVTMKEGSVRYDLNDGKIKVRICFYAQTGLS